jgi:hypothetical protein
MGRTDVCVGGGGGGGVTITSGLLFMSFTSQGVILAKREGSEDKIIKSTRQKPSRYMIKIIRINNHEQVIQKTRSRDRLYRATPEYNSINWPYIKRQNYKNKTSPDNNAGEIICIRQQRSPPKRQHHKKAVLRSRKYVFRLQHNIP